MGWSYVKTVKKKLRVPVHTVFNVFKQCSVQNHAFFLKKTK